MKKLFTTLFVLLPMLALAQFNPYVHNAYDTNTTTAADTHVQGLPLSGTQITSGTVADARLSGNVALLNAGQTFTAPIIAQGQFIQTNWDVPVASMSGLSTSVINGLSDSPFSLFGEALLCKGSTGNWVSFRIPSWVTNTIVELQYEFGGSVALTITNESSSYTGIDGGTRTGIPEISGSHAFIVNPNGYTFEFHTNSYPDLGNTNGIKEFADYFSATTNASSGVWLSSCHVWATGVFRGTNY